MKVTENQHLNFQKMTHFSGISLKKRQNNQIPQNFNAPKEHQNIFTLSVVSKPCLQ